MTLGPVRCTQSAIVLYSNPTQMNAVPVYLTTLRKKTAATNTTWWDVPRERRLPMSARNAYRIIT